MALFDAWFNAVIVLDANILLSLFRFAPDKSRELLDILEGISNRIWIPRQFWEEYQGKLPTIRQEIKREYLTNKNDFQNLHQKKIIKIEHFSTRTRYELNPQIALLLDQANTLLVEEVSTFRSEHSTWLRDGDIEKRIEQLFASKVGDPLPDSNLADIPSMWQWRLDRGIPPGLKDRKKRKPYRYGDLIGWLQIKRHANGRDRPVIMVTDDAKANDWLVLKNGNPSGPHPDLTRELNDEAGVELHIYTSEQFMWLANMYLKWQRHVAAAGDYIYRLTPTLLPGFGKIAANARIFASIAANGISKEYKHTLSAMAGLTALGASRNYMQETLAGLTAFDESRKYLQETLTVFAKLGESRKHLQETLTVFAELGESRKYMQETLTGLTAFDESRKYLQETLTVFTELGESRKYMQETLAGFTVDESLKQIHDAISGIYAVSDRMERLQSSMAGFNVFNDRMERFQSSLAGVNAVHDRMNRYHDSLPRINVLTGGVQQILEQQRKTAEMMQYKFNLQHSLDEVMKPTLSGVIKNLVPSISDVLKDLTPSTSDMLVKPSLGAQQRETDAIMKRYVEEQRRTVENIRKNMSL